MKAYRMDAEEVLKELGTSHDGISQEEAQRRLEADGYNELKSKEKDPVWKLFLATFKDAMVIVLLVAAAVQLALGEVVESIIIFLVILLNSVISVVQTKKAESSLEALQEMSAPSAKVVRGGESKTVPAKELTKGDIVQLDAGDYVPADGRLISSESLKINEGMLTGESEAADKKTEVIEEEASIGDRINMVHSGSLVVNGRGSFIVTAIAQETEIGQIANMIETAESKQTPLQKKLDEFSKRLGIGVLVLCILIFAAQAARLWFGDGQADMTQGFLNAFTFSVAVAVAAIPEALSSIVTIVMAVGTTKMAKQQAIIRRLPAVETLGSTRVICTDKTGTLTQNKMTVTDTFVPGKSEGISEDESARSKSEQLLLNIAVLCNDSSVSEEGAEIGDPTETALIHFGKKMGLDPARLRKEKEREMELPFDSDRKMMSTVYRLDGDRLMLTKGGPDVMFERCTHILIDEEQSLDETRLKEVMDQNEKFSDNALRVLAYGYKKIPDDKHSLEEQDEQDLVLVGLTAMIDPPREAVPASIAEARSAGIRSIMITGDHKTTAQAIGKEIGLMEEGDLALTGKELDKLSEEELDEKLGRISVYARVSPENKIRIVRAWQNKGSITAMTGDGVNDAPALKQADIGIAMGSGTDVAKDSSAMVLADDNFVSIVNAVGVGRTVFDNIKKAIGYLFAGNLGAIIAILFAVFLNMPNPFTALQLLFINLINDSLPALALGMEKEEPDVMKRKPRDINEGIFSGGTLQSVIVRGVLIGAAVIVSFYIGLQHSTEMGIAMAFTTLILARTLQTFSARSNTQTIFKVGFLSNKYVLGAVAICFLLYGVTVLPGVRSIFSIPDAFGWRDWSISTGLALAAVILMEIIKAIRNRR
ncbi:cation-translocating P-type ATPase [Terribacillus saccharophilus]|uniref:cation-translocating P-type ATPase n=1 Tax=Terribacillus saccharophilus TaxID=361277 RepID=UPI002DC82820|nr:cation-translocating P-type ATPase [Terribacillus saccharophilus]